MTKTAYHLGNGATIRDVASSVNRRPTAVHRVKQLAEGRVSMREEPNFDRALLSHFVAFCLLENPMASGNSICTAAQLQGRLDCRHQQGVGRNSYACCKSPVR